MEMRRIGGREEEKKRAGQRSAHARFRSAGTGRRMTA